MSKSKKSPKWLNGCTAFSSHERGFTLIELLVVISILAILAVIGIVVFSNITGSARDAKRKADIQAIAKTMEVNYNPGSGYQKAEGFTPPREGDYKIILGENNQSFLTCTKLEKATSDVDVCSLNSDPKQCFCLRSTQGSDKYPNLGDDNAIASPVYSTPVTETAPDITTGLAGYWKMDESSWNGISGEVIDSSVNGNNGTSSGGATRGIFDGNNDEVTLSTPSTFASGSGARTISLRMKPAASQTKTVFGYGVSTSLQLFDLLLLNGVVGVHWSGNGVSSEFPNTTYTVNAWQHVTFTYDGTSIKSYMNGDLKDTVAVTLSTSNSGTTHIGSGADGYGHFNGAVDEVRVYNRALSAEEISYLYNLYNQ